MYFPCPAFRALLFSALLSVPGQPRVGLRSNPRTAPQWHQIYTLSAIFGRWLAEGGIYIIEDIETSYWDAERPVPLYGKYTIRAGAGTRGSAVEKLKQLADVINRRFSLDPSYSILGTGGMPGGRLADHEVASLTFTRNAVSLVKKTASLWRVIDTIIDPEPCASAGRPDPFDLGSPPPLLAFTEPRKVTGRTPLSPQTDPTECTAPRERPITRTKRTVRGWYKARRERLRKR